MGARNCKVCAENPLEQIFAKGKRKGRASKIDSVNADRKTRKGLPGQGLKPHQEDYEIRSQAEIKDLIDNLWMRHVHARAWDAFKKKESLQDLLEQIAGNIPKGRDPIIADDECVVWLGEYINDDPCIGILKPDQVSRSQTFVNRILAYVFASDESFMRLQKLPKDPLRMACGNPYCVNLAHVDV